MVDESPLPTTTHCVTDGLHATETASPRVPKGELPFQEIPVADVATFKFTKGRDVEPTAIKENSFEQQQTEKRSNKTFKEKH